MKRREFVALGAGVLFAFRFDRSGSVEGFDQDPRLAYPTDFNAYLHFGEDGQVTCFVGKIEMGQGNMTALAQLVADELTVPLARIEMVMGDTDRCPWDLGTFGSMSIAVFGPVLRRAAAEAREVLRGLAAEQLDVPADQVGLEDGVLFDTRRRDRALTYGALARGRTIARHLSVAPKLTDPASFRSIGQSVGRLDAAAKVTGRAQYTGDIRLPGMLYAAIVRPPAHGASLSLLDTSPAETVPGAKVVRDGDLVAVVHERPDGAALAAARMRSRFDRNAPPLDDETIFDHLIRNAPPGRVVATTGSLTAGFRGAGRRFQHSYRTAYAAHAPMETHSAVARIGGDNVTVWASTQAPFQVRKQVAEALHLTPERVRIVTPYVGGGFGGKTMAPQAVEAARLARAVGRPVQVVWDRREEFFFDTFRPAAVVALDTALDAGGKIIAWQGDVYGAGEGGAAPVYEIPHQRVVTYGSWQNPEPGLHPFGVGAWRAPGHTSNVFAREQQMDIMAATVGIDPLTFRLGHLSDQRLARVLRTVAHQAGWTPSISPSRRGIGLACGIYSDTRVAMLAQVVLDLSSGNVRVERVVVAQDMGLVINPDGARAQIEGSVIMGLGSALTEEVPFKDGAIGVENFDTYLIPRFSGVPRIEVTLIDAPDTPPSAGGEPGITCVAAAIGNAIADATGRRMWRLPMTPNRIKAALENPLPAGGES
jgi:isoquinoline 1-oxidoreductase